MKIHQVEQRSPEWYSLRAGIPTASEFSKLITSTGEASKSLPGYALTLAAEAFAGKPLDVWEGTEWTERGRLLEAEALKQYEFVNDCTVEPVGFVTDDAVTHGCSPDALVGPGMVEVKCLKAENHIKAILYWQKNGTCPTDYVQQTQGQMMICERAWCDLIFYHPELPPLTIRQMADADIHAALRKGITNVLAERDRVLAALHNITTTKKAA